MRVFGLLLLTVILSACSHSNTSETITDANKNGCIIITDSFPDARYDGVYCKADLQVAP